MKKLLKLRIIALEKELEALKKRINVADLLKLEDEVEILDQKLKKISERLKDLEDKPTISPEDLITPEELEKLRKSTEKLIQPISMDLDKLKKLIGE